MTRLPGFLLVLVLTLHVLRLDGRWYWAVATMVAGVLAMEALGEDHSQDEQEAADGGERPAGAQ